MGKRVAIPRWHGVELEWIHHYHDRLRELGIETADVCDSTQGLRGCDGLLLTGGVDIDPSLYGEFPHLMTQATVPERDELELTLLREALARDVPVLAICRGHQLLNVCLGGSLLQHIEGPVHVIQEGNLSSWHEVRVEPETRLHEALGVDRTVVNSRHHQGVTPDRLATGLKITALSNDGVVEGFEGEAYRWLVGVQWHPERPESEAPGFISDSKRLFEAFSQAIGGRL